MQLSPLLVFIGGLVIILLGAELLLKGASRLAAMLRVSPILIGLTVVSVGTSTPELAVGITAAHEGKGPLAVGNIAGTNMVNILLILGLSAWMRPLPTRALSIRLDVPVMIASALTLVAMGRTGCSADSKAPCWCWRRSPTPRPWCACQARKAPPCSASSHTSSAARLCARGAVDSWAPGTPPCC